MAGEIANKIEAKSLILNHFSQRYKPIDYNLNITECDKEKVKSTIFPEDEMEDSVQKLVDEAKLVFRGPVLGSYDLFTYNVI